MGSGKLFLTLGSSHASGRDCEMKVTLQLNWGIMKRGRREGPVWVREMGRRGKRVPEDRNPILNYTQVSV